MFLNILFPFFFLVGTQKVNKAWKPSHIVNKHLIFPKFKIAVGQLPCWSPPLVKALISLILVAGQRNQRLSHQLVRQNQ